MSRLALWKNIGNLYSDALYQNLSFRIFPKELALEARPIEKWNERV